LKRYVRQDLRDFQDHLPPALREANTASELRRAIERLSRATFDGQKNPPRVEGHSPPRAMAVCLVAPGKQAKHLVNLVNPV